MLSLFELSLEIFNVLLADLHKEDSIDDVEHVKDAAHRRRLDLDGRQGRGLGLARVDLVHLLLEDDGLLSQVLEALGRLLGLVVVIAQLSLVDGERLLLILQRRPEVAHAALGPGHQVIRDGNLQALDAVVFEVQLKGLGE